MNHYKGKVISEGLALGNAYMIQTKSNGLNSLPLETEKEKVIQAIASSIAELKQLREEQKEDFDYLTVQILLLEDPNLKEKTLLQMEKGLSAIEAITNVIDEYMKPLQNSVNGYLKERVLDLSDIKERLLNHLFGIKAEPPQAPFILVCEELHPSFLIQNKKNILGIISSRGGYTSHGAILCRQFDIPYMISEIKVEAQEVLIIDTRRQQIIKSPSASEIEQYKTELKKLSQEDYFAVAHEGFQFLANISDNSELDKVLNYGFDGVGLYRTEMIFMNSNRPYTLEEQYEIYSFAVKKLKGKSICFRTFDLGNDKQLAYVKAYEKVVDNYIQNPGLFKTQIEALLMANHYNTMKIMFPKILELEDYLYLKNWVLQIQKELKNTSKVEIGIMLETKEALDHLELFRDCDFISIGTNDLIYSIYHIHREKQKEELQDYLKDLLSQLKKVVDFCKANHIKLSICGELAAIGSALREFIKIGVKNFSVAAPAIKVLNHIYKEFF